MVTPNIFTHSSLSSLTSYMFKKSLDYKSNRVHHTILAIILLEKKFTNPPKQIPEKIVYALHILRLLPDSQLAWHIYNFLQLDINLPQISTNRLKKLRNQLLYNKMVRWLNRPDIKKKIPQFKGNPTINENRQPFIDAMDKLVYDYADSFFKAHLGHTIPLAGLPFITHNFSDSSLRPPLNIPYMDATIYDAPQNPQPNPTNQK